MGGKTYLGTAKLDASGHAVFVTKVPLAVGKHAITVLYSGDGIFATSTSLALSETIVLPRARG
jgi:hypothetical protein